MMNITTLELPPDTGLPEPEFWPLFSEIILPDMLLFGVIFGLFVVLYKGLRPRLKH